MRKAQIWISAVLYVALGVIVITIVLGAGLPLINKLRDRNTIIQTKDLMNAIDKDILDVSSSPGAKRFIPSFNIERGRLFIGQNILIWNMTSKYKIVEPGYVQEEGNLKITSSETFIKDEYVTILTLEYNHFNLTLNSAYSNPFSGSYGMTITHTAEFNESGSPVIEIKIV